MGDFLDSLPFLTPEQRASLRADDLDTAVAFAHVTVSMLQAPPFGLTIGKASRLLAAAQGEAAAAPAPATMVVGHTVGAEHLFYETGRADYHPQERMCWDMACAAQQELTSTDPNDALANLD